MNRHPCSHPRMRILAAVCLLAGALSTAACGGAAGPPRGGGRPPTGVEVLTLEPRPVETTTEYIATVKSRRSVAVQPEVEGFLRRILVRSGDRVESGRLLMEIDSGRQSAAVASLESDRAAAVADVDYARLQAARLETVFNAGAVSLQELEAGRTDLRTAEARLVAIEERIREQQVELDYFRVTAPVGGILGDIPVRTGDRVTPSSVLTTIDSNTALEVYINIPIEQADRLTEGLEVRIVDHRGAVLAQTSIAFVSPKVDERTQSILVKAPLAEETTFRNDQIVRARLVWSSEPGLTLPVFAVSRVSGRFFAFVAEESDGRTVARQRAVRLGPIVGNDYVVLEGLAAGERLIVSGVQKIGDGAPVDARPAEAAASAPPATGAPGV